MAILDAADRKEAGVHDALYRSFDVYELLRINIASPKL